MGVTRDLARFVANTRYEDISPEAVGAAKLSLLNILGNCVAGNRTRIGALHIEMTKDMGGGRSQATIIGDGTRVSAPLAAFANGNLGFALDYEDTVKYVTHPGFITTASGLAVGEMEGSSGRELILAMALGYEVVARIGLSMQPTPERGKVVFGEQYHPFAAAVTAGKLLHLDEEQLDVAFGVAGTYSSVPSAYKYFGPVADTRPIREVKLGWGWMCMAGTLGALSAKRGFRGGHGILDGDRGFHVMAGSDRCDFERITRGLGESWLIVDAEYKGFPAIARIIPAYFAASALVEENKIVPADVETVVVRGGQIGLVNDFNPRSAVDAQFSLPFLVVMAITRHELGPDMFADSSLFDPTVRDLLSRVVVEHDVEADAMFFNEQKLRFSVTITLKSGARFHRELEYPRDQRRLGRAQVEHKFRTLAGSLLPSERVERTITIVDALDELESLNPLIASVCVAPAASTTSVVV
jgi:2-methylcitrate dehydratase PrpD